MFNRSDGAEKKRDIDSSDCDCKSHELDLIQTTPTCSIIYEIVEGQGTRCKKSKALFLEVDKILNGVLSRTTHRTDGK